MCLIAQSAASFFIAPDIFRILCTRSGYWRKPDKRRRRVVLRRHVDCLIALCFIGSAVTMKRLKTLGLPPWLVILFLFRL